MYRTLSELRDSIDKMIESQGENAPCAAFLFTQHDVFEFNEETNQDDYFSSLFTEDVLADVGGSSYIYEQVGEMIDDSIRLRKNLTVYSGKMWQHNDEDDN
jgi:transcriptional/translational regulatory protein YebC/TACO1